MQTEQGRKNIKFALARKIFNPLLRNIGYTLITDHFGSSLPFMLNQQTRCQDNILLTQKFRKFLKP
jgi:hypothetical protein